ncbi:MAG: twin-arginine translocase TatA/TatE family subunit [Candidatus Omnitrophica bacterium]|nr:twin-arginine translocase TatA/TatE family subunit [Candidatus Omnitrophota bacterium]MBI5143630.1 twin-arginine translocase TatA/TatE family subunit [Candidatus Omnitrophota bacterium]
MFGIGMPELLVILLICLLIFGAAKLPEIGKALGKTINEFKKGMREIDSDSKNEEKKENPPSPKK